MPIKPFASVILCSTALLRAQPPAAQPAGYTLLEGQVVNAVTGEPLKKAQVALRSPNGTDSAGTVTDASGHFALAGTQAGKYRLYAERNGYVRGEYGSRRSERPGTALAIAPGQHIQDLVIRLFPQGVISGRVLDEDGEPLPNVDVQAMQVSYSRGGRRLAPVWAGTTDDLGEFRAYGLNPGRYFVAAAYRPNRPAAVQHVVKDGQASDVTYAMTYFPSATEARGAAPIEVAAGAQIRNIELSLLPRPAVSIRGRIMNPMANSGGHTTVTLVPRDGTSGYLNTKGAVIKDMRGSFELQGVTPGSYTLYANWSDGSRRYTARQPLEVGAVNIEDVSLAINGGADVVGHVRLEGNANVDPGSIRISLEPRATAGGLLRSPLKPGGAFALQNVAPETYDVNVIGAPEGCYIKSARVGQTDVLEKGLDLEQGVVAGELEVLLSPRGGQIDGVVSNDSQTPTFAMVVLVPDARRRNQPGLYKTATTDQYGHFTLQGIAPGDYTVFAWDDVESGAYQDPEFLGRFETRGERVTIAEGAHQSVQLKLIPAE